jgi:hypothetical protein
MDAFSPEFTAYWLAASADTAEHRGDDASDEDSLTTSQQVALEELAERVCAARRVV